MSSDPNYCSGCYGAAKKAGRPVKMTDVYQYPICSLCESRIRNGLIHYQPSNGTEFEIFESGCERCRHFNPDGMQDASVKACAFGIMDKILNGAWEDSDSAKRWFDPLELDATTCPATCKRFTDKNDPRGDLRDPPPPDCKGQMLLEEVLDVPEPDRVRQMPVTK